MSRNKHEGKYAGKLNGKHCRSRAASVSPSRIDCYFHINYKEMLQDSVLFNRMFKHIGGWPVNRIAVIGSY